ncbi:MAG: ParB/RepB/Spo0J family partition protein [Candidatus Levybacteria bacterium]|nr:ParB/RepB/Spo0J family partition protein [Candidatus Levybacteria bacterium]MBI2190221.1 ParB/RepB/Spo0J family partition protein [Candidatus Levybacteria bacterium]MBI2622927.1 ParB/RepB/Spo0J family partition protein [Candidatus Levybacteria bacterium]MBI3070135.1 ParB/RepB/Spo0J family partition protein [Candidatus Levybacteria bacterium]MBI3093208.1 ParB/RepB/Spo0J family partition protein [Candidatus Levybacteria bacterium]
MDNQEERIFELDTNLLQSNPLQPRGIITPESLTELVDSIREQGILEPLVIAKTPAGYQIIAGERRWRAARILGFSKVPVVLKETTPQGMLEMSIVENVQREDLNPIERALAYKRLIDEFGLSTNETARRVGKSAPAVSNTIRLLSLPDAIKDALVAGVISEGHVRPLISLGDSKLMLDLFKKILRENSTVRQTEEMARKVKGEVLKKEPRLKGERLWAPELDEMASDIEKKLALSGVTIFQSRSLARMVFAIRGEPETTTPRLKELHKILTQKS